MPQYEQSWILNLFYIPAIALFEYLQLDHEKLSILAVLMGIDILCGVVKARSQEKPITSQRLMIGFGSKLLILLIPFVIALLARGVEFDINWFVKLCITVFIIAEVYSILGNIYTVRSGKEVEQIDTISYLLKIVEKFLMKTLGKDDERK